MNKYCEQEIFDMLQKINQETQNLLEANLPTDEFHKKHQELIDYWNEISKKIQQNHPGKHKPKAIPKHKHHTHHMTDKYLIHKIIKKLQ